MNDQLKVSDTKDRIFNRVISDIFVVLRETTLTISYFIETVSPVQSEILRVVTPSRLARKSKPILRVRIPLALSQTSPGFYVSAAQVF